MARRKWRRRKGLESQLLRSSQGRTNVCIVTKNLRTVALWSGTRRIIRRRRLSLVLFALRCLRRKPREKNIWPPMRLIANSSVISAPTLPRGSSTSAIIWKSIGKNTQRFVNLARKASSVETSWRHITSPSMAPSLTSVKLAGSCSCPSILSSPTTRNICPLRNDCTTNVNCVANHSITNRRSG